MDNRVPDFDLGPAVEASYINKLYGNALTPQELIEAKDNLASFIKLLVRIDRRIRNEAAGCK